MQKRPVAVVTGASSGFGMLTSVALAEAGYMVISTMRNPELRDPLDKLAMTKNVSDFIEVIPLGVTSEEQIVSAVSTIIASYNPLSPYAAQTKQMISYVKKIKQQAPDPAEVVSLIVRAATTPKPRLRYPVGRGVGFTLLAKSLLPWKWIEYFVRTKGISPGSDSE